MNIGARLEAVAKFVLPESLLADIGTDHAYLPVFLVKQGRISGAIAGDIAQGPCRAAENTVAMHNMKDRIKIRLGSGLKVLQPGEAECISIAGMGGSTIVSILEEGMETAVKARRLVLQPQTGAAGLRRWLLANGWEIVAEELAWEHKRLYEIIAAERRAYAEPECKYSDAELEIGPLLLAERHPLLKEQFAKVLGGYYKQLDFMRASEQAVNTEKYKRLTQLVQEMVDLANDCNLK